MNTNTSTENKTSIYIYGTLIILVGIFLIFSKNIKFDFIKIILGSTLTVGAIIAFISALTRQRKQIQFAYHEMHALAMLVYGVSIIFFGTNLDTLVSFTSFLLIFYTFSEIIFCNWIFNLSLKVVFKIVIIRLLLALIVGVGAVLAINFQEFTFEIFGSLFMLVGINILLYVPIIKRSSEQNIS